MRKLKETILYVNIEDIFRKNIKYVELLSIFWKKVLEKGKYPLLLDCPQLPHHWSQRHKHNGTLHTYFEWGFAHGGKKA